MLGVRVCIQSRARVTLAMLAGLLLTQTSSAAQEDLFSKTVAPILARRCLSCHDDAERKGSLSLQSAEALQGGEEGPLVVPGDAEASVLIERITPHNGVASMPEDADPLSDSDIQAIRRWIDEGAHWPADFRIDANQVADLDWWSLHPLQRPELPQLDSVDPTLLRNPIDHFILARLKQEGLSFSSEADRRTLIRRLYFDLLGLPPTPEAVEQFVQDPDPLAYEKLVDTLLESPHYGERWARHWLDVVQYGDSHGYDKDKPRPNAWPYRDYVIRAFNEDKPYSRFVQEQLAGDRLWPDTVDGIVATGFMAAGPWDFIGHAEVPESKIDGKVARNLDRDNMVSSTLNTFMSLTVQCARCHNHKFDPVTMQDYYSLQAVFAAIDRADRIYDPEPETAARRAELLREQQAINAESSRLEAAFEAAKTDQMRTWEQELATISQSLSPSAQIQTPRSDAFGYHSEVASDPQTEKWVQVDLGASIPLDHILLFAADEYGFADFGFPERYRVDVADDPEFQQRRTLLDATAYDVLRPGAMAIEIPGQGQSARYVRVTATRLWNRRQAGQPLSQDWIFALGELAVISQGKRASVESVTSLDSIEAAPRWSRAALVDQIYGTHPLATRFAAGRTSPSNGFHSQFATQAETTKWVTVDLGQSREFDQITLFPARPTDWNADTPGFGFPVRYRLESDESVDFTQPQVLADFTAEDVPNPGDTLITLPTPPTRGRFIRLVATKLWDRGEAHFALAMAELQVSHRDQLLPITAVTASDSIDQGRWHRDFLVDGHTSRAPLASESEQLLALRLPQELVQKRMQLEQLLEEAREQVIAPELRSQWTDLQQRREANQAAMATLPPPAQVFVGTVHQGSGAFRGRAGLGPREIFVLARGEVTKPGAPAYPGTIPLIPDAPAQFDLPDNHDEGDRRVALANWITREDNPLTWRSIVNRVWLYHFGQGLVDSPNDFGRGGQLPSHPELLDWLAVEFRDGGQSLKGLHRLICLSTTYRQTSLGNEQGESLDAGNRLLWRMNRRRLTAEEIRDSMLVLSGRLDTRMGGPGFQDFVIEQPEHSPHYEYHKYNPLDPTTHRRSIYRFIVRSQPQPFLNTLDCADPSMSVPKRDETQTSLQALALLNNQFVVAMSEQLAGRAEQSTQSLPEAIEWTLHTALAREPSREEIDAFSDYARQHGLANACRMILNLNEFAFID